VSLPEPLNLRALLGPHLGGHTVHPGETAMIGRLPTSDVCLMHEGVSRRHLMLSGRAGRWYATDQGSVGGSFLNGVKLKPHEPAPVSDADLLRIGPWTFRVCIGPQTRGGTSTVDDGSGAGQRLSRIDTEQPALAGRRLRLLTRCIGRLGSLRDEDTLVAAALDVLIEGTGYGRAAVLRPGTDPGEVSIVAVRRADPADHTPFTFSRSLIHAASGGQTFVLSQAPGQAVGVSIAEMGIHSAACAPIMLGDAAAGYVYLDARAAETGVERDAAEFCESVASVLGMAWGNLKRGELERRQAELTAELAAAREVQQVVSPPESGRIGRCDYAAVSRPGVFVAGDLFDALTLPGERAALSLGDVAGHGAGSGMLMALTQSHLSAVLRATGDPAAAVMAVNEYLCGYALSGRFVSLWVGMIEADGWLRFVDAGHGLWFRRSGASATGPDPTLPGDIPIGIDPQMRYTEHRMKLAPGESLVLFSDGVVEQRDPQGRAFGIERLLGTIGTGTPGEMVRRIFADLDAFAGRTNLDDDATVAVVTFTG